MIAVIRIHGQVGLRNETKNTLERLKLRKKYTCIILKNPNKEQIGMINSVKNFVSYGEINEEVYEKILKARGKKSNSFFTLHPPRKGIDAKKHAGVKKGVLGYNKKINELIERML